MKLIFSPASPFVRKVRVMVHEAALSERVEDVAVTTTALATDPAARAANPLGKIPALILENGQAIFDSRVICRYLDDLSGAGLYPSDRLWDVLTLEALADGIMESAVLMVYETRLRPEEQRSAQWVDAQWSKITHALDALETNGFPAMEGALNSVSSPWHARLDIWISVTMLWHGGKVAQLCPVGTKSFRTELSQKHDPEQLTL